MYTYICSYSYTNSWINTFIYAPVHLFHAYEKYIDLYETLFLYSCVVFDFTVK